MILKIAYKSQIRIFNPKEGCCLQKLHEFITKNFKKLDKYTLQYEDEEGDHINIDTQDDLDIYLEQEKRSKIFIKTQEEENKENHFERLDSSHQSQKPQIPELSQKLLIKQQIKIDDAEKIEEIQKNVYQQIFNKDQLKLERNQQKQEEQIQSLKPQHNVSCDQCKSQKIIGIRYKCAVCQDFDLCSQCQEKAAHNHPMIKIREPHQAPLNYKLLFNKPLNIPKVQQKLKTKIDFQSSDERRMIVVSYLQNLLGQNKDGKFEQFALSYKPTYQQDILQDYLKWTNSKNQSSLPKMFKWIKTNFNNMINSLTGGQERRNE